MRRDLISMRAARWRMRSSSGIVVKADASGMSHQRAPACAVVREPGSQSPSVRYCVKENKSESLREPQYFCV